MKTKKNQNKFQGLSIHELYELLDKYIEYQNDARTIENEKSEEMAKFKKIVGEKVIKLIELKNEHEKLQKLLSENQPFLKDSLLGRSIGYPKALDISAEVNICSDSYMLPKDYDHSLAGLIDDRFYSRSKLNREWAGNTRTDFRSKVDKMHLVNDEMERIIISIAKDEYDFLRRFREIQNKITITVILESGKRNKSYFIGKCKEEEIKKAINKAERIEVLKNKAASFDKKQRIFSSKVKKEIKNQIDIYQNCPYCHAVLDMGQAHADHIYPIQKGGHSTFSNMVYICASCNLLKSTTTLRKFIQFNNLDEQKIYDVLELLNKDF